MSGDTIGYVAGLDIGTTTLRCQIINQLGICVGNAVAKIKLHYPDVNSVEIDPDELWTDVISVVKNAVLEANISMREILSMGISTQRGSFLTWRKDSGKPLHNFITWKDLRALELIKDTNKSWKLWTLRKASSLVYFFTRHLKFGIVSQLKFFSNHVTIRLLWFLKNNPDVQKALLEQNLMFGTIDTWLIYKLTGGKTYVSDISNASATGMYDPFALCWSFIPKFLNIPVHVLPTVVDNDFDFGNTMEAIFGLPIKIATVMADQSASLFGLCGFQKDNLKITLGTGAFMDVNTGRSINGSLKELISSPSSSDDLANQLKDNGGVYFVPAFSGLGPPINNEGAASGFIGIKPTSSKAHMVRAVLESIVYRTVLAFELLKKECHKIYSSIRVDGGVSKSNFICQMLADMTNIEVTRCPAEMSVLGVAYVAGLSCGLWQSKEDLCKIHKIEKIFEPTRDQNKRESLLCQLGIWENAAGRFSSWYI